MNMPRFIQIHTLHNYSGALLNRDDSGQAKRLPYGDAVRTRISSQCLKRQWRVADDNFSLANLEVPMAVRSRDTLKLIRKNLIDAGLSEDLAQWSAEGLRNVGIFDKGGKNLKGKTALETGQAVLMGYAEIDYLVKRCVELAKDNTDELTLKAAITSFFKDEKNNIKALKHGSGLESALFGRMVTSDVLSNRDAAVYVAHAFTVHPAQVESDYFTVVDDLNKDFGNQVAGTAGIFDTELTSGLYYGYVVVDVPQLIANLEGEHPKDWATLPAEKRELSGRVVKHLLHLIATVSPGAKRGSTAPFEWAKFLLVEVGNWQPRSLAGAFQNALSTDQPAIRESAVQKLSDEISKLDNAYGSPLERRFLALDDVTVPNAHRLPLNDLAAWVQAYITQGTLPAQAQAA